MSRTATPIPRPTEPAGSPRTAAVPTARRPLIDRELIESLAVAFCLALLVRTYAVEAFVIPTGSMAPTLMGRHKDVVCPQCGQSFPINASQEVDRPAPGQSTRVKSGLCSNCQFPAPVGDEPSFKGDRILVMKFPYRLPDLPGSGGPARWDVVVFAYPEIPEQNYIKRLVGLPGESLRVSGGDLLSRPQEARDQPFRVARKPAAHQQAMQTMVYDDAHRPAALEGKADWLRWVPGPNTEWKQGEPGTYGVGRTSGWQTLAYRHLVPDPQQWASLVRGVDPPTPPRPTLITDFNSYNTGSNSARRDGHEMLEPHWVGDLTLACRVDAATNQGRIKLELMRAGVASRCEIDVAAGTAQMFSANLPLAKPRPCGFRGEGSHDLTFANVDGRLNLWVDGATPFGDGVPYDDRLGPPPTPTPLDLNPASVAVNGLSARVSRLVLKRDIYYTLYPGEADYGGHDAPPSHRLGRAVGLAAHEGRVDTNAAQAFLVAYDDYDRRGVAIFDLLANPALFPALVVNPSKNYEIRPGHYMMLGDNSPHSKDGRAWTDDDQLAVHPDSGWDPESRVFNEVPADQIVGKAFFIYWPHGVPFWPNLHITPDFVIPFRPYFERMKTIH